MGTTTRTTDFLNWHDDLAPGHSRAENGELLVGGLSARALTEKYGTPLVTIDFDAFDAAIREFEEACAPHNIEIAYAGKALLLAGLAKHIARKSLMLDVSSLGEIATAERGGFPAQRMMLHGSGKPDEELDAVITGRVGTIVVDSIEEIERLGARASSSSVRALVRVNTGIEAHTHEFVRTGGDNTKFGIPINDLERTIAALRAAKHVHFAGLHSHIGSQIYDADAFVENVRALIELSARFAKADLTSELLIVGGGFGVQNDPGGDRTIPVRTTIDAIARGAQDVSQKSGISLPRLGIEPGRALIARAGTSLYRVMARKRQNERTFVVVDGSLADNPRPALYDAYHHTSVASLAVPATGKTFEATICGRSCENDVLGYATLPETLRAGDLVAMCTTGAYTYSMAGNYNRFAKPAVVALQNGEHRLLARRETLDEVLAQDCI